jgi:3-keto-5-aminohexanoate cleavage enzyme
MAHKKYILNFTPTGLIPNKEMTAYVPISPKEIMTQVLDAAELGVSMVHLHARDQENGAPTFKKDIYGGIIQGIRKENKDIILCVSTSGRLFPEYGQRSECLDLDGDVKPDFASLTLSSVNFNKQASINTPDTIQRLAARMKETGIRPEFEVFDLGMINYAKYLIRKQYFSPPYYFNFILGNIACAQADLLHLGLMIKELPEGSIWSVGGVGNSQLKANVMGLLSGGGVRIGLEDNIWYDENRTKLATNRALIERILLIAESLGHTPYSPLEARELLGCR